MPPSPGRYIRRGASAARVPRAAGARRGTRRSRPGRPVPRHGHGLQQPRHERRLDEAPAALLDPVGARALAGADHLDQVRSREQQPDAVVHRVAGRQPVEHSLRVAGPPVRVARVVDGVAAGKQPEALGRARAPVGARDPVLEPAHRAGAHAAEHDAALPRLAQRLVEPVDAPDREQVREAPAADVDHVLGEQVLARVHRVGAEPEQREVREPPEPAERAVEAVDLLVGVAARGGQEADRGVVGGRQARARSARAARRRPTWRSRRRPSRGCAGGLPSCGSGHGGEPGGSLDGRRPSPRYDTRRAVLITRPRTLRILNARASGRDETARSRRPPAKWSADAVACRVAGPHAVAQRGPEGVLAPALGLVVDRVAAAEQAEAGEALGRAVEARDALREPAQRAGADARRARCRAPTPRASRCRGHAPATRRAG